MRREVSVYDQQAVLTTQAYPIDSNSVIGLNLYTYKMLLCKHNYNNYINFERNRVRNEWTNGN